MLFPDPEKLPILTGGAGSFKNNSSYGASNSKGVPSCSSRINSSVEQDRSISGPTKSSLFVTSINYINAIVGSGVLAIPYALRESGLVLGVGLLMLVTWITSKSLVMQVASSRILGTRTYQETVGAAFGRPGFYICAVLQFLFPFFALISYNIIVGDTITKVLVRVSEVTDNDIYVNRQMVSVVATLLVTLPLSSLRNIGQLGNTSFLSMVLICFIIGAMIFRAPKMAALASSPEESVELMNWDVGPSVGVISFAFVCHHTTFLLYNSLEDNTDQRWKKATNISVFTAMMLCLLVGCVGYLPFTGFTQGDIMENYCWDDDLMAACRAIFAVSVMLTFPLECFGAREVLETTFFRNRVPLPLWCHLLLTFSILLAALLASYTTDCLSVVLQFSGIFVACPMAFLLPAATFIKAGGGAMFSRRNLTAWTVLTFGAISSLTGTLTLLFDWDSLVYCAHGVQMDYCFTELNGTKTRVSF